MRLRVTICRYWQKGKPATWYEIERPTLFGWETLWRYYGFARFRNLADAEEYVRLYNAIKRGRIWTRFN